MKTKIIHFILALVFIINAANAQKGKWTVLFNGGSTDKFRGYTMTSFPNEAWKVEDGALATQTGVPNIDLVTKEAYKNFELVFDWKVSKAGNSGVFFHMQETLVHQSGNGNSPNWLDNYEFQLLDDINFNDTAAIRSAGSLYDLIIPKNKTLKPVGEYNQGKLIVKGNHVEHWLNGKKVVQYEMNSPEMTTLLAKSKFSKNPKYGKSPDGLIMLQHHGQKVWFKNIRVRRL
ncbi:MAG: 3-keto-disaccharide hydrolase [Segetibacter sp.]